MEKFDKNMKFNLKDIERKLALSSEKVFESYASVILKCGLKNFRCTRSIKDNGIDGYFIKRKGKNRSEFFSIYGPTTKALDAHKRKLFKDFNKILEYTKNKGYNFKEWHVVLNFEITEDFESYLEELCKNADAKLVLYTPVELISLIKTEGQLFTISAYILGVDIPFDNYSDYHYHKFLELFVSSLKEYFSLATTEKIEFIKKWEKQIIKYTRDNKLEAEYVTVRKLYLIKIPTHLSSIYSYIKEENTFLKKPLHEHIEESQSYVPFTNDIWKSKDGNVQLYAENLGFVYSLLLDMLSDIESARDVSLNSFIESQVKKYDASDKRLTALI